MKNNTAMEELIGCMKDEPVLFEIAIKKATLLLEKEKRIIVEAFDVADNGGYDCPVTGEQYFTQTFKKD